ncbi:hypothetical protein QUC31_019889 [Theobroma cacao]
MALLAEEVVSLSKSVQEMSVDGDEPPSRYIVKDSFLGSADDPSPSLCPFPILDISHFSSPSSSFPKTEVDKVLQKLKSALSSSGCFQAIGHGISSSFVDKVRDVTKQLFALPETEKQKYAEQLMNLKIMSNGIFKSPVHRVVTNLEKLRISVALFNEPEPENEIRAVDGLVDENRPRTAVQTTTGQNSFACRTSSQAAKHPHCLTSNMAGMALSSDGVSLSRSMQEMSMNGDEPPPEFYVKDSSFTHTDYSDLSASISVPVIDINLLLSSKDELEKLRQALSSGGCFQAIGHGISNSFIDKVREVAKQFFGLPQEEKQKYSRAVNEVQGYGHDLIVSEKQVLDWNSRLFLRVFPEHQRKLDLWPENPNNFREVLHEYSIKVKHMMDLLFQAMAKSLNLEENSFSDQFGDNPILSNGIFKSPMHRVVTNTDKLRISVALFNEAEPDKEIGPVEGLIDDNRPRLYRNVKNYASFNYECFQNGKVALEEVKFHA